MIKEDYCSYEVAKILKEKGFNESCYTCYVEKEISHYDYSSTNYELIDGVISCPTIQMAMKWLREVHKLVPIILAGGDRYWFRIDKVNEDYWKNTIYLEDEKLFPTYEEACEASIKYCLENLI